MVTAFIITITLLIFVIICLILLLEWWSSNPTKNAKYIYRNKHTGVLVVAIFTKRANQRVVICKYLNRRNDKSFIFKQEDFLKHFYFEPLENI